MEFKRHTMAKRKSTPEGVGSLPWCLGISVCFLLFIQVLVSNRLATTGYQINKIEGNIEDITSDNEPLKEKIASASAFITLKIKAEQLGFTKSISPAFFSHILPVALNGH